MGTRDGSGAATRALFLLLVGVLPGASGCSRGKAVPGSPAASPNILLVTIDTLRADRLGCYGYRPAVTPVLDGLAS